MNGGFVLNRRSVVRNLAALTSGSAFAQGFTALALLFTARALGPDAYGQYSSSLTLASLSAILFNLGLEIWLMRSGGRQPERLPALTGAVLAIKLGLGAAWLLLITDVGKLLDPATFPPDVLFWMALVVWFDALFYTILTAFKTALRSTYAMLLEPLADLLWLGITLALITASSLAVLPYVQTRAIIFLAAFAGSLWIIWRRLGLRLEQETIRQALRETPPYGTSQFLASISMRIDLLLVSLLLGKTAAGIYSPPLGVINALFFIPGALYAAMNPVLSNLYANHPAQARKTALRTAALALLLGLAMFAGTVLASPLLVRFLGEKFASSLNLMYILSIILLIKPLGYAAAAVLVAAGYQAQRVRVQLLAAGFTLIANLVVIYPFGLPGVAVVYVLTEILLLAGYGLLAIRADAASQKRFTGRTGEEAGS